MHMLPAQEIQPPVGQNFGYVDQTVPAFLRSSSTALYFAQGLRWPVVGHGVRNRPEPGCGNAEEFPPSTPGDTRGHPNAHDDTVYIPPQLTAPVYC